MIVPMENQLGLYVHIPFCRAKCSYCNFNSSSQPDNKAEYLKALETEARLREKAFAGYQTDTVYFGGGTPSVLEAAEFSAVAKAVASSFAISPDAEITVECNPESVTGEKLASYRKGGVTRISLGVQSLTDGVLKTIGRVHTVRGVTSALDLITGAFENVSVDIILGLPGQNESDLDRLCNLVRRYHIPHVSAYGLKVEEGTRLSKQVARGELSPPDEDFTADLYDALRKKLSSVGLFRYEISNFARPGSECRHNVKYWTLAPYLGLGVSAHSYAEGYRFYNGDSVEQYILSLAGGMLPEEGRERISAAESEDEYIMLRLRTSSGINRKEFLRRYHADFAVKYADVLTKHTSFFSITPECVALTAAGYYVINSLLIKFTQ